MNTRTGEVAHDVAWARPLVIPGALILGYNGAALATRAQVDAWGRPFLMGFESSTTRAYAGGDAGEADAAFSCDVFDSWGYPRECGSWVCAADSPSTPAQFLANCEDYGSRYAQRMVLGGRHGPILAYGNPDAVEAVCRGIRRAGLTALRWGVGTWGYGEGGGANRPPAEADAELIQSGNTPGQAEGTDLNWLYAPVSVFAALGGPTTVPLPEDSPEDSMQLVVFPTPSGHVARLVEGLVKIDEWRGDGTPATEAYGIPIAVTTQAPIGVKTYVIRDSAVDQAARWVKLSDAATAAADAPTDGGMPPAGPTDEQRAAVTAVASSLTDAANTLTAAFAAG